MKEQLTNYLNTDSTITIILALLFILIVLNFIFEKDHNEEIL